MAEKQISSFPAEKQGKDQFSVVEPEPQGTKTFGRSRNDVSALASNSSQTREFHAIN
jgi:hypothetical protein